MEDTTPTQDDADPAVDRWSRKLCGGTDAQAHLEDTLKEPANNQMVINFDIQSELEEQM